MVAMVKYIQEIYDKGAGKWLQKKLKLQPKVLEN